MKRYRRWAVAWSAAGATTALAAALFVRGKTAEPLAGPPSSARGDGSAGACEPPDGPELDGHAPVRPLCRGVYTEAGLDAHQLQLLRDAHAAAAHNIADVFGEPRATPLVIFCQSAKCKIHFGAPASAATSEDLGFASVQVLLADGHVASSAVVASGPGSATTRVLTHELVHAEMKAWLPYDALPTWFQEGTATYLANEPPCDARTGDAGVDITDLATKGAWQRHLQQTGKTHETYCAARSETARWMSRFASPSMRGEALKALLTRVASGTSFDAALAEVR